MMNEYALNSSVAALALASFMLAPGQAHALSLSPSAKPTLQNTVLKSSLPPEYRETKAAKVIKISRGNRTKKTSPVRRLKKKLQNNNFSEIYFTKTKGKILEAEACKNNKRYFLQISDDGQLLQATQFDRCKSPRTQETVNRPPTRESTIPVALNEADSAIPAPIPLNLIKKKEQPKKSIPVTTLLAKQGYDHIYAPANKKLGVMACKNGIEYAFQPKTSTVSSWQKMVSKRRSLGKCFGFGKQILTLNDLLSIMHRHGDTQIRVVSGKLPMFEAYSCLNGQRRHVKINRWGNDNIRTTGKCS